MRLVLPALALLVALALTGVVVERSASVEAGTARKMDVTDLVDAADLIVQAEVLSADGKIGARGVIETEYVLRVSRTFWGQPLTTRVVRIPGGVLPDGRGMLLAGMPQLREGEEALLFLTAASASGMRMPVGLAQGKFQVERLFDGSVRLLRDQTGLGLTNPSTGVVQPAPGLQLHGYADVVARIQAAVAGRIARAGVDAADESGSGDGE